ncbi:MAG: hypothetical protein JO192_13940 [Candidatus Eremiobacteraeota bacterium]|nr:hypothetical protein [Candidatus Eremiobacteraeota bacterium]
MNIRPFAIFVLLCMVGGMTACSSSPSTGPIGPTAPPTCALPTCLHLSSTLTSYRLAEVNGITPAMSLAGTGTVLIDDNANPFPATATSPVVLYVRITAIYGPATLTYVPGFRLVLSSPPLAAVILAELKNGKFVPVGKAGTVKGNTVTFPAIAMKPPLTLPDAGNYDLQIYSTALNVAVACNQSVDICHDGSTIKPGKAVFTAIGDTATLTPSEGGAASFTLLSDTCNKTDDPSAGGNWATISPGPGSSATAFTVTAKNAGKNGNESHCSAIVTDASGQQVTIDIGVTLSSVGIGK